MEVCCCKPSITWSHRGWKGARKGSPPEPPEGTWPANTLTSNFWPGTMREYIPVALSHQVCYVSPGKLIQAGLADSRTPVLNPTPTLCEHKREENLPDSWDHIIPDQGFQFEKHTLSPFYKQCISYKLLRKEKCYLHSS